MKAAAWADRERWQPLVDGSGCPICVRGEPLDVVAELAAVWVTASTEAPLPAYACVVSKVHAVEPFELDDDIAGPFWHDAMTVARRLAAFAGSVKMNYGIHGNVIPHLHMHLWPRLVDDPYDTGGITVGVASFTRSDEDLAALGAGVRGD
jgi:diadenosine tetraphosphate (Ap4A) HIT family hydrolase